jgi:hypothetical protein
VSGVPVNLPEGVGKLMFYHGSWFPPVYFECPTNPIVSIDRPTVEEWSYLFGIDPVPEYLWNPARFGSCLLGRY